MQKAKPFSRAITMMHALAAALSLPLAMQQAAMAKIGEYESRGKGLGRHSGKKWGPFSSGKYTGISNGKRERARRVRQIERGIIAVSA